MSEQQLAKNLVYEQASESLPFRPPAPGAGVATPFPSLPADPYPAAGADAPAPRDQSPEGHLPAAAYRRDAIYRRALALADVAAAGIAVLVGVPILGQDSLNPAALLALPLVLV